MTSKAGADDLPFHSFASVSDMEVFLEREHTSAPGIFLKLAKKSSGIPSISASEAVEVALCFGWIDGRANSIDENWWTVRYTPRRSKSMWSQKNVATVARLLEAGRIRPAGLAAIEAAKADGRWDRAYAGPATITVPDDLTAALNDDPAAAAYFATLNRSERYSVLWRLETASSTARANRLESIMRMLAEGKVPGSAEGKAAGKVVQKSGKIKPKESGKKSTTAEKKVASTRKTAKSKEPVGGIQKARSDTTEKKSFQSRRPGLRQRP